MRWPKVPSVVYLAIGVVAVVWLYVYLDRRNDREVGRWSSIAKRLQQDSARAANTIQRVDTVLRRDTIRYTRSRDVYRDRVDSIQVRLVDTVFTERERVIISAADTALARADSALVSAVNSIRARDTLIRVLGEQRTADRKLYDARLRAARPLLLPYVEAGKVVTDAQTYYALAGAEIRIVGALRLTTAFDLTRQPNHTTTAARVGLRVNFR